MKSLTIYSKEALPTGAWLMAALLFVLPLSAGCDSAGGGEEEAGVAPSLRITTVTDGREPDVDGYTVMINGAQGVTIGTNETVVVPQITSGSHRLDLEGVDSNCTAESNTHSVNVAGPTEVTFAVNCFLKGRITFRSAIPGSGGFFNLYVARPDGSERVKLTSGGRLGGAAFSPDGSKIVYSTEPAKDLWIVEADGGEPTQLTQSVDVAFTGFPTWSRDGSKIGFIGNRLDDSGQIIEATDIYVMDADGSNIVNLTNDDLYYQGVSWSPDGSQLVTVIRPGHLEPPASDFGDLYVMNADGTDLRNITEGTPLSGLIIGGEWSPVDSRIVFDAAPSPELRFFNFQIYRIDANGANLKQLTRTAETAQGPTWRPDGKWIVFYGQGLNPDGGACGNGGTLGIMNPDGLEREWITDCSTVDQTGSWTLGEGL